MGFSTYYLKDHNFILTHISDEVDDHNLKQYVLTLNKNTEGMLNIRELADCRCVESMEKLTSQGTAACAELEKYRPDSLLAILVTESPLLYGLVRTYQTFAEGRRKEVKIFTDINQALTWLANDEKDLQIINNFAIKHLTSH